ncbi:DNA resolvase [Acetobacter pasteurianus NBRC 101655]|uniref:recombinase family protein n=1 Tax=Acetobacter pasteurianus TaxID=438 RepID=UPI00024576FF|nr:recombinase family protein [Acetobacter pasteurianus]BAU39649.1 DNA resolvase [Acetobacter pasteurianus NBRC 101655]CCT59473.1 DNA resolvase [Acetobacter pasteurianus 386B]
MTNERFQVIFGYARTSTIEQEAGLEAQKRDLSLNGCERIYAEQISGSSTNRPELTRLMDNMRSGDVLIITKPDRLARSTSDLLSIVNELKGKGCELIVLSMGGQKFDTSNPTSKLMLHMLAAISEFERDLMKERQKEGIQKAKKEGKYKGRKPIARMQQETIRKLKNEGMSVTAIAEKLKLSRMSVYRVLDAKPD